MENLNKDTFWDNCYFLYPKSTQKFCNWIDEYKKKVGWTTLFKEDVKFHDIPLAMQTGIWLEYMQEQGCYMEIDVMEFDLEDDILNWMCQGEMAIQKLEDGEKFS